MQASLSASAATGDASLVDLTPGLKNAPMQVDLLGTPSAQCFLAQLGSSTSIPAGNYQQVRIFLESNTSNTPSLTGNQCLGAFNCVVLAGNPSPQTLQISTESTDGIVLTLASGKVTREEARACRDRLKMADIKVLGAVLNRYRSTQGSLGRRYRYYESYGAYEQERAGSAA